MIQGQVYRSVFIILFIDMWYEGVGLFMGYLGFLSPFGVVCLLLLIWVYFDFLFIFTTPHVSQKSQINNKPK